MVYDRALVARVASLRERFDVWGTGERPQGFVAPGGQNEQLNSIDRFEFGIRITHGLELSAEVHARSQKDADKLAASLALLQMMAQAQSKTAKFEVKAEDSTLKFELRDLRRRTQEGDRGAAQTGARVRPKSRGSHLPFRRHGSRLHPGERRRSFCPAKGSEAR